MTIPVLVGREFRERYALQRFRDGGVLVDLATGMYLRLNASAVEVCSILTDSDELNVATTLVARQFGLGEQTASEIIRRVMEDLVQMSPRREPPGDYRYLPVKSGDYVLTSAGVPRVIIDRNGLSVRLVASDGPVSSAKIYGYLRAIAPKALFLQSMAVIHGAASHVGSGVRVISGESGAGKTTTARIFDAAGARLFAEDMLIVAATSPLSVYSAGERAINAWAQRFAESLADNPQREIDASLLCRSELGHPIAVSEIWFIDGSRRTQSREDIRPTRLGETDGGLALMTSLFLGSVTPNSWRTFLSVTASIAGTVPLFEALMPKGLDRLQSAARRYMENSAS